MMSAVLCAGVGVHIMMAMTMVEIMLWVAFGNDV